MAQGANVEGLSFEQCRCSMQSTGNYKQIPYAQNFLQFIKCKQSWKITGVTGCNEI